MKIARKIELAEQAIRSITQHHDAPEEEIKAACAHIVKFIDTELAGMPKAREAHAARLKAERARKAAIKAGLRG